MIQVQKAKLAILVALVSCGISFTRPAISQVRAWGYNANGELGDGTATNRYAPVQVSGLTGVTAIAGGYNHSLAILSDGTVWAWGSNALGQLGDGTITNRSIPVQMIGLTGVTAVAGGGAHSLA